MMFDWYKKKRLDEQIKFFGGTRKRFVSIYAKQVKPRIRVKNKVDVYQFNQYPRVVECLSHPISGYYGLMGGAQGAQGGTGSSSNVLYGLIGGAQVANMMTSQGQLLASLQGAQGSMIAAQNQSLATLQALGIQSRGYV